MPWLCVYNLYTSIILNDLTAHTLIAWLCTGIFLLASIIMAGLQSNLCTMVLSVHPPPPKKKKKKIYIYTHMVHSLLCFGLVWYQLILPIFFFVWLYGLILPILFRVASLTLGQSYDCPSASEVTLNNMGKYVPWIHHNWWYDYNKNVCIFYYNILSMPYVYQSKAAVTWSSRQPMYHHNWSYIK